VGEAKQPQKTQARNVADDKPKPPFPPQHQERPGLEQKMTPRPEYKGKQYLPAGKLEDKVALVTGGDSGIGRSVAYLFAREGADVAIVYLEEEHPDARELRDEIRKLGRRACSSLATCPIRSSANARSSRPSKPLAS
jgi:hypothetical protein